MLRERLQKLGPVRVFLGGVILVAIAIFAFVVLHERSVQADEAAVDQQRQNVLTRETDLELDGSPLRMLRAATLTPQKLVVGSGTVVQLTLNEIALPADLQGFDPLGGMLRAQIVSNPNSFDVQPINESWQATTEPRFAWKWQITAKNPGSTFVNYVVEFRPTDDGNPRQVLTLDDAMAVAEQPTVFLQKVASEILAPGGLLVVVLTILAGRAGKTSSQGPNVDARAHE